MKPGDKILHYQIIELLGSGGMGVVYKAHDTKLDRTVALKFLPAFITINKKEFVRLKREALITASINHKSVATIYDFCAIDEYAFLVMEYIKGETLKNALKKSGPFPKQKALDVLVEIAKGLQEAHNQNIYHRDIKSENIMITPDGELKIMDFGLAKMKGTPTLTSTDSQPGTIAYMSPEQIEGKPIDNRSDIWSLGVVLYELLTGHLPFTGDSDASILYAILKNSPPRLKHFGMPRDNRLEYIVQKMLEKEPANRYQSLKEFLVEISSNKRFQWYRLLHRFLVKHCLHLLTLICVSILAFFIIRLTAGLLEQKPIWLKPAAVEKPITSQVGIERGEISPNGRSFVSRNKNNQLFIKNLFNKRIKVLKNNPDEACSRPHWSADGKSIYYISGGMNSISRIDTLDTFEVLAGPDGNSIIYTLDISPAGEYISYSRTFLTTGIPNVVIYSYAIKTKQERLIYETANKPNWTTPHTAWHPSNKILAISARTVDNQPIFQFYDIEKNRFTGDTLKRTYDERVWYRGGMVFSPDGRYLIYPDSTNSSLELVAQQLKNNGTTIKDQPRRITRLNGTAIPALPGISQNGQIISYIKETTNRDIAIAPFGPKTHVIPDQIFSITNNKADDYYASWGPFGDKVCFLSTRDGQNDIYVWDGKEVKRVTNSKSKKNQVQFFPDGNAISFLENGKLYKVDSGGQVLFCDVGESKHILSYTWGQNKNELFLETIRQNWDNADKVDLVRFYLNEKISQHLIYLEPFPRGRMLCYSKKADVLAIEGAQREDVYYYIGKYDLKNLKFSTIVKRSPIVPRGDFSWLADGQHILYGDYSQKEGFAKIKIVNINTHKISPVYLENKTLSLLPGQVSPDGKKILLYLTNYESDIVAIGGIGW